MSDKKLKIWFAVKRTKHSARYHFYEPDSRNRKTIETLAPEGGNFSVVELVDIAEMKRLERDLEISKKFGKSEFDARAKLCEMYAKLELERDQLKIDLEEAKASRRRLYDSTAKTTEALVIRANADQKRYEAIISSLKAALKAGLFLLDIKIRHKQRDAEVVMMREALALTKERK